ASVNLHSRGRAGTALLTWEADRILTYKLVTVSDGDNPIGWAIDGPQFPNFTLTAARMWENKFDEAKLDIEVERDLRVTVSPVKPLVGPGDEVELEVTTVDQLGRPASAEISIAMIDRSILRLYGDRMPAIGAFFYNQTRTGAFSTEATNAFHYAPATIEVAQAVVDEAERIAAVTANMAGQAGMQEQLRRQVATEEKLADNGQVGFSPLPAAAPSPADSSLTKSPAMMEGMGGAMGAAGGRSRDARRKRYGKDVENLDA